MPDIDTPGYGRKRELRYTDADLYGEERQDLLRRIRDCSLTGMTDFEIETTLGIKHHTLARWAHDDAAVAACLEIPSDILTRRVERALYAKATGYSHAEVDIRVVDGKIVQTPIIKHYPPDTGAAIFWLKNKRPDLWKDKREFEGAVGVNAELTDGVDARRLAMSLMALLNEAAADVVRTIDHEEADEPEDQG